MVDGRRLVVVVVVDVKPGVHGAPCGDEVDELLERLLLAGPVEGPDLGVPGHAVGVAVRRVDDAEQVLEPELLAVLRVVPGALDVEEQVALATVREGPAARGWARGLRHDLDRGRGARGVIRPHPLALDLESGLQLRAPRGAASRPVDFGQLSQLGELRAVRHAGGLQRHALCRRHAGDQRQVVVVPPPRLYSRRASGRWRSARRVRGTARGTDTRPPRRGEILEIAPDPPFIGGEVGHPEGRELAVAEGQVHRAGTSPGPRPADGCRRPPGGRHGPWPCGPAWRR